MTGGSSGEVGLRYLAFLASGTAISGLVLSALYYSVPVYMDILGYQPSEIGIAGSVRSLPYLFLCLTVGRIYRAINSPRSYALAPATAIAASLAFLISPSLAVIIAAQVIVGIATAFYFPFAEIIIAKTIPPSLRSRVYSLFGLSWSLGFLLGPGISGWVLQHMGPATNFVFLAFVASVAVPILLLLRSEYSVDELGKEIRAPLDVLASIAIYISMAAMVISLMPGLASRVGYSPAFVGLSYSIYSLARILAYLFVAKLSLFSTFRGAVLAALIPIPGLVAILDLKPQFVFPAALAVIAVSTSLYYSATYLGFVNIVRGDIASMIGLYEFAVGIGFLAGPLVSGFVAQSMGIEVMMMLNALLMLPAAALLLRRI